MRTITLVEKSGETNNRSFRIDKAIENELEYEAQKHNISVSKLIEQILENYLNHYRYVEQRKALTILPETMNKFLEYIDENDLAYIGEKIGETTPRQAFLMRGIEMDQKAAINYLSQILGDNDNWFNISIHEGKKPYLYIRNALGPKWITFIEGHIRGIFKSLGYEVKCIRVGDNLQILL